MHIKKHCIVIFFLGSLWGHSQTVVQKAANDAFMITRMADKFHVKARPLNDNFSSDVMTTFIKRLDGNKTFLTQEDINKLEEYRFKLDEEIAGKKTAFLQLASTIYSDRLQQLDTMVQTLMKLPIKYTIPEKYTAKEDSNFTANLSGLRIKIYKKLKYSIASAIAYKIKNVKELPRRQKLTDSIDAAFRKKIIEEYKVNIQKELQSPGGIIQLVANDYCKSIAVCFDPHSAYMTLTDRDNFESQLGKKNFVFGFKLEEDDDGSVLIDNLAPGSAAFKSGMLNKGDKIISIQWEGAKPIDVSKASVEDINDILSANNHAKATLTVMKPDGTKRQVELAKEKQTTDNDEDRVKSYLLRGDKTIGYISLPSFYEDWEDNKSINGCSNDVAKEIMKLKKEGIDGLVLDLRYNGGGSVSEAVDLAGIFIDAGPIAQVKTKEPKAFTLKDQNRGTIYDGPLTLLVNGFSASASELLAGSLQDYNRALIVGSTTYGKGTGQRILRLDTTIDMQKDFVDTTGTTFLKLTNIQVYRVSGSTAQFKGVIPDIVLPDATDAYDTKEKNEAFAIPANTIDANKYYIPYKALPLSMLQEKALLYQKDEPYFVKVTEFINQKKSKPKKVDVSLKLDDLLKDLPKVDDDENDDDTLGFDESKKENKLYKIDLNKYEKERINSDSNLKDTNDDLKELLEKDPYLRVAYRLMLLMNK